MNWCPGVGVARIQGSRMTGWSVLTKVEPRCGRRSGPLASPVAEAVTPEQRIRVQGAVSAVVEAAPESALGGGLASAAGSLVAELPPLPPAEVPAGAVTVTVIMAFVADPFQSRMR